MIRPKRGTLPLDERDDRVGQGGQQAAQMKEGEDRVAQAPALT